MLERMWRKGNTLSPLIGMWIEMATIENSLEILLKLRLKLPYDPTISLRSIYPEAIIQRDTCAPVFTAAPSTAAWTWKQPSWPSTDERIETLRYIYTLDYYSDLERNECELAEPRWMSLKPVIQSEVGQKKKNKYCILTHIWNLENGTDKLICGAEVKTQTKRMDLWAQRGKERRGWTERVVPTWIHCHVWNG